jgi:hypothetical protein
VLEGAAGDAGAQFAFNQSAAGAAPEVVVAVGAPGVGETARPLVSDVAAHILDGAADGVLAVKGALRAAQHFDALDVEDIKQGALGAREVDVVHVEAHTGIDSPQGIGLAHAAHEGGEGGLLVAAGVDREVRDLALQL